MISVKENTPLLTMPVELRRFVLTNCTHRSPYNRAESGSYYNTTDKSWNHTPDGSIRVSDHWNFYSRGEYHCKTDIPNSMLIGKWAVAQYCSADGLYHVVAIDELDMADYYKHYKRTELKNELRKIENQFSEIKSRRLAKVAQIKREREAAARAKKVRNGFMGNKGAKIWAEVNVNVWSGGGRRVRFAGTETLLGYLTWESKTGSSFCIKTLTGHTRELRKWNSYKEYSRKPRN